MIRNGKKQRSRIGGEQHPLIDEIHGVEACPEMLSR
jgi:hypothetical protein